MVGLNRTVYRSLFMVLLLGLVPVSVALGSWAFWQAELTARALIVTGSLAYLLGVFAVTAAGNIPMNTRLVAMDGKLCETAAYWPHYARRWARLNHVRTAASFLASVCWLVAAHIV